MAPYALENTVPGNILSKYHALKGSSQNQSMHFFGKENEKEMGIFWTRAAGRLELRWAFDPVQRVT